MSEIIECPYCGYALEKGMVHDRMYCAQLLQADNARLTAELAELNDKAVFIKFENEDELPIEISNDVYSAMFNCSHVDGVRLFPYIEENGQKYFFVMLREDE